MIPAVLRRVLVFVGSLIAVYAPLLFLVLIVVFVITSLLLLRWLITGARRLFRREPGPS